MALKLVYKELYNEGRSLPEPKWGSLMVELQCPYCDSHDVYGSAHPDDPEEIFPYETVRCRNCGRITDWYEARKQWCNYFTLTPRLVEGGMR